ncbi:cytochrome C assembly family protein [Caldithrix abyssi]|uniref:ABC-type uncharacterized transport system, permease component n=1 Tax=Caldithrix abyssi DSM 13497 TaxID=880073 RepID=H1XPF0_CALAY|nr:cytochrome c biogenesis protein CcsA [Caldithrix abyssi]APF19428.1 ABC-type uncharacterized transport system, permease component [Caldithrix abyssi DSM 13497]EHO43321.1 cytochrome c assembly protein [Caldithrix abyssi DSM 13497]
MQTFSLVLSYLLPVFYLIVLSIYYRIYFGNGRKYENRTKIILLLLIIVHGAEIVVRQLFLKAMPLSSTFDALSFLGFSILLVYYIIEKTFENRASGFFILLFAFFPVLISAFQHDWQAESNPLLSDPTFTIHASLNIIGYTALAISAIYALLYLIQYRNIKEKRFTKIFDQLPAVSYLESMSKRAVLIGIILMGIGIFLGHVQTRRAFGQFFYPDPKVIITDLIWLSYLIVYVASHFKKWSARIMAYLSIFGFIILLTGMVIALVVGKSFHEFY